MFSKIGVLKNGTPTQMFSCEYCEIFKSRLFYGTPLVTAFNPFWTNVVFLSPLKTSENLSNKKGVLD